MAIRAAFIGLGNMGFPMAGHLAKAGFEVCVYNRSAAKAADWQAQYGGDTAATPEEAARDADFVFSCVGNDADVREIARGARGAFTAMKPGAVFVDHTTTSAELARELAAAARDQGLGFLDAPVSGGQAGAQNGVLTVMVGGDAEVFERSKPLIQSYAAKVELIGPAGYGQLCKMVNQICIAGLVQGLSEGIHFAQCAGLDLEKVMGVISKGAAQSWQMENRWKTMAAGEFDFGFAVDWMRKDLGIAMAEAHANGAQLPVTELVDGFYEEVQQLGGRRWDTSSLIARLKKMERKV